MFMAMQHYEGKLGVFDYDDNEFKLEHVPGKDESEMCLRYIGEEIDGSKIKIPEGIKVCNYMFMDSPIETPPVIPDGVTDCEGMFYGCKALKEPPVIPNSVINCEPPVLPLSFTPVPSLSFVDTERKFLDCKGMEQPPVLHNGIENIDSMFSGCPFEDSINKWGTYTFSDKEKRALLSGEELTLDGYTTRGGQKMNVRGRFALHEEGGKTVFGFVRTDVQRTRRIFPNLTAESETQAQDDTPNF